MSLFNQFYTLDAAADAAAQQAAGGSMYTSLILIVVMVLVFYFIGVRPQKKQEKETQKMRDSLTVGDEITTIGGIVGKVVNVREDMIFIETGSDRTKMKIARWAIRSIEKKVGEEKEVKPASFKMKK